MTNQVLRRFAAGEWYNVPGRGRAAIVVGVVGFDPRSLQAGDVVEIDGDSHTVKGVETYAVADATGTTFSILVA